MMDIDRTQMTRNAFVPGVTEKLAFYVYLLIDPRNGQVFYVGKAQGTVALRTSPRHVRRRTT
jgi:hypothetical protein